MKEKKLTIRAAMFAARMHEGQVRKFTGKPYIIHPIEVGNILSTLPGATEEMIAAGILHDTVEDTDATFMDIVKEFGEEVGNLVYWVTKVSVLGDGNRAVRKAMDRDKYAMGPAESHNIKVADMISNARDLADKAPGFAKVWMAEASDLLLVLGKGDKELWARADAILVDYFRSN
jgi:(p)ppGpp synthase/HD superfamily hydrolase